MDKHHAWAAEGMGPACDELRVLDGGAVDVDLFGSGQQNPARMSSTIAEPPPTEKGMKICGGHPADHLDHDVPAVAGGRDVVKDQFIGPGLIIEPGHAPPGRRYPRCS